MKKPIFTLLCGLLVILYHLGAWHLGGWIEPRTLWHASEVGILMNNGRHWTWRTPRLSEEGNGRDPGRKPDCATLFSILWVGVGGNLLNYATEHFPDWMTIGARRPKVWFFLTEDRSYLQPEGLSIVREHLVPPNMRFVRELRAKGITTVLLPIPAKAAIHRESAPPEWRADRLDAEVFREIVKADPRWTVDLESAYLSHLAAHPSSILFRPLDTHWTSLGIAVAAKETVSLLAREGLHVGSPSIEYDLTVTGDTMPLGHFMLTHLFLPEAFTTSRPELRWEEPLYSLREGHGPAPKGAGRLLVFGTSFVDEKQGTGYSYGELLSRALQRPLINNAADGNIFPAAVERAQERGLEFHPGDIVVLEYPIYRLAWTWDSAARLTLRRSRKP